MQSEMANAALLRVIQNIECNRERQKDVDHCYKDLTDTIIEEMTRTLLLPKSKNGKRKLKQSKPFANEKLTILWKHMCENEKKMTKCTNRLKRRNLREEYIQSRKMFDKELRCAERIYKKSKMLELETLCINDPKQFYEQLKKLGPRRKAKGVPWEVVDENGTSVYDHNSVLTKWKTDFELLFWGANNNIDRTFLERANTFKTSIEREMTDPLYKNENEMNHNININEVRRIILKAKNSKATGDDQIPYEVLKYDNIINALWTFYQLCFASGIVPSE